MDSFINAAKSLLYSLAISLGLFIPSGININIPSVANTQNNGIITYSTTTTAAKKSAPLIIVQPKEKDFIIEVKKSTSTLVTKPVKKDDVPVIVTRELSEYELRNKESLDPLKIVALTNIERAKYSLPPLTWNEKLASSANIKARDMITKQYFAHESPDGVGIEQLAQKANYSYSLIGENLAMGDFISSSDVVKGWMDSPGHRANILKPTFKEIGVSAMMGKGEGHSVWYSVQEFGRQPPACLVPDVNLESIIKNSNSYAKNLGSELSKIKSNIESGNFGTDDVKMLIDQYNQLVNKNNSLHNEVKDLVSLYNSTVKKYNDCVTEESNLIKSVN